MDQMLPSPGFSIPSIGTPIHQPEEDQQILPHAQQQQIQAPHMPRMFSTPSFSAPQSLMQPQTPVCMMCELTTDGTHESTGTVTVIQYDSICLYIYVYYYTSCNVSYICEICIHTHITTDKCMYETYRE